MVRLREFVPQRCPGDFARLVPAYIAIWNAPENLAFLSQAGSPVREERLREWFACHLAAGVRYFAVVEDAASPGAAAAGEEILGIVATRACHATGYEIIGVAVRPARKRQGIGRLLLRHAVTVAREGGFDAVDVQVLGHNKAVLCLLLDLDFLIVRFEAQFKAPGLVRLRRVLGR